MKNNMKGIWITQPKFLYPLPHIPQNYDVVLEIIQELEKRDFQVPYVEVTFTMIGHGMDKYKYVSRIKRWDVENVKLSFDFPQGNHSDYDLHRDNAALHSCRVSYDYFDFRENDEIRHFEYIGDDWTKDRRSKDSNFTLHKYFGRYEYVYSKIRGPLFMLLVHIKSVPEISTRTFQDSMFTTIEDFHHATFEPYPSHFPNLFAVVDSEPCIDKIIVNSNIDFNQLPLCECIIEVPLSDGFMFVMEGVAAQRRLQMVLDNRKECAHITQLVLEIRPHYVDNIWITDFISLNQESSEFKSLHDYPLIPLKEYLTTYIGTSLEFRYPQYLIRKPIGYDELIKVH
jgi:hypothetical protein